MLQLEEHWISFNANANKMEKLCRMELSDLPAAESFQQLGKKVCNNCEVKWHLTSGPFAKIKPQLTKHWISFDASPNKLEK
jgi:hypothetical protein